MRRVFTKLFLLDKIMYFVFIILMLILLHNFVYPTTYSFALVGILFNLFLILIFIKIFRILEIKFTKKQLILILFVILMIYIYYLLDIMNRKFIYYSDFTCYYNITLNLRERFSSGLMNGISSFVESTSSGEYGSFITFFSEPIFVFTDSTINSYIMSYILTYIPYIVFALAILLKKVCQCFELKEENVFFNLSLIIMALFPLVHAAAIYGQPDLFGLTFIFLIISLTIKHDFKKLEVGRLLLLLLITVMLIISRRWYIYWLITYYIFYIVIIIIKNIKNKNDICIILKHIFLYGVISFVFIILILSPLIKNIFFSNIGNYSTFYLVGGFPSELKFQLNYIGYLPLTLMAIGLTYGLRNKKTRIITIMSIFQYFLIIFMFTRLQNMAKHHSLILVPTYLFYLYLLIACLINSKVKVKKFLIIITMLILIANFISGINFDSKNDLFTKLNLTVEDINNYDNYIEVAIWLKENVSYQNTAYMICHNSRYNADKFRNILMPDKTIYNNLPYGSAVIGVHSFPLELFTAKYILTTNPFENISMEYKYNIVFNQLVEQGKFKLIKSFDMNDGYYVLIYERIQKADETEKNMYLEAIKEESEMYPTLYRDVINNYIIN